MALPPTVDDLKTWSRVDFGSLDAPYSDDDLQIRLDRAMGYLMAYTGRAMDDTMPVPLVPIAEEAIQLRTEQIAFQEQPDYVETSNDDADPVLQRGQLLRDPPRAGAHALRGRHHRHP